jgi:hypothetical protein
MRLSDFKEGFTFLELNIEVENGCRSLIDLLWLDVLLVRILFEAFLDDRVNRREFNLHFQTLFLRPGTGFPNNEEIYLQYYAGFYQWVMGYPEQLKLQLIRCNLISAADLKARAAIISDHLRSAPPVFHHYLQGIELQPDQIANAEMILIQVLSFFRDYKRTNEMSMVAIVLSRVAELRFIAHQEK